MRSFRFFLILVAPFVVCDPLHSEPVIEVFAGDGSEAFAGDGALATETGLGAPMSLALDGDGRVLFADAEQGRILRVEADGTLVTLAGTGLSGFAGDGGPAKEAFFSRPMGLVVDASGQVYVADRMNHRIRKIDAEGRIESIAGNGTGMFGLGTYSGDGMQALDTALNFPSALLREPDGALLVADRMNGRVRRIDRAGTISTLWGGEVAKHLDLKEPADLARDASGELMIVDIRGDRIWAASGEGRFNLVLGVRPEISTTPLYPNIAIKRPVAVSVASNGDLYWAESGNNRVCRISENGTLEILMKGPPKPARGAPVSASADSPLLGNPSDLLCLPDGALLVADPVGRRIWRISNLN